MSISTNQPLNGIKVLEIGTSHAVKLTGMILRDCGADVVILDSFDTGSDISTITDRSKNRVSLSETPDDLQICQLLKKTDVIIDDGHDTYFTKALNDRSIAAKHLIHCLLPSLSENKSLAQWNEDAISAAAGLFETPSGLGLPRSYPLPIASTFTAFHAVNAIVMALIGRQRNGNGYFITIPLEKAALSIQIVIMMIRSRPPAHWEPFRWLASPFAGVWKTADNGNIYIHAGMPRHLRKFMFLLESSEFSQEKIDIKRLLHKDTRWDPMKVASVNEALGISRILHSLFLKKSSDFWEQFLSDAGLCCAKIRPFEEWKNHPQVLESKEIIPFTSKAGKKLQIPGKLMESPNWDCVALEEGESLSLEKLSHLWTEQVFTHSSQTGSVLPLQGVRVLDMSRIIAGPFTGRLLAEYGAEVIHLTIRDKHLSWEEPFHIAFNSGKKSVVVNCSHPGGRQELIEVIKKFKPDILVHNYLEEATEKLGIDYKSMKEINPEIIYLGICGYNSKGPWAKRPGFEQCIQAASGMLSTYSMGTTPQYLPVPFVDMSSGLITSFSAALCCFQRNKGTGGNCVSTGLTITAIYLQINSLSDAVPNNSTTMLNGYYRSKDTLLYLSVKAGKESLLTKISEFQTMAPDKLVPQKLRQIFRQKSCSFWQKRLIELSLVEFIQIVPRVAAGKLLKAELKKEHGLFSYKEHEGLGNILVGRSPVTMTPQGICELPAAQASGKSTAEFQSNGSAILNNQDSPAVNLKRTNIKTLVSSLSQYKWILVMLWHQKKLRK